MEIFMTFVWTLLATAVVAAALYFSKPWWQGQRTRITATVLSVLGVITTADLEWLPDNIEGPLLLASGILFKLLRQWTTTPAGTKEDEA